jgi:hypothetical protein
VTGLLQVAGTLVIPFNRRRVSSVWLRALVKTAQHS